MKTKTIATILSLVLTVGLCQMAAPIEAATPQLSTKKFTIEVGKTATLRVKKTSKKAKWSIASGKKYIRLTEKKKTSVRIKALKAGKAKISCKIGKKKLICKVTVKKTLKPVESVEPVVSATPTATATVTPTTTLIQSPTVTASATPIVMPTSTPTQTPVPTPDYEIKSMNTPGPVADYDCLKVEVGEWYYSSEIELPIDTHICNEIKFFGTDIWRKNIEQIIISDSNKIPEDALGQFDLSEKQNGSVMAWYIDKDVDGKYEVTIGQNGGVVANVNSAYLFSEIRNEEENEPFLIGIENLDTSHVENMDSMFFFSEDQRNEFDLGDNFDTSNVKDISNMFRDMGFAKLQKLRLGAKFDVSKIEKQESAFENTGNGDCLYCYVKDTATRDWFVTHAQDMMWHIGVLADWTYHPENDDFFVVES
ncbi:MAG: BspA family leucine-rich repeat surface protein [Clostridiales bacterium]|nr:BspA family leucine-rich repeat surface protein [Clostridiales bacterium]